MGVEAELKVYVQVLWRYKKMIAICAIIAFVAALGISFILKPIYSATATVRVAASPGGAYVSSSGSSSTRLSNTYVDIATSSNSLDEVAKRLGMQRPPSVQVDIVPETELIRIKASDPDPGQARDIANTLADLMVQQSVQLYGGNAPTSRQMLENQLTQAKADLDKAVAEYDAALRSPLVSIPVAKGTPVVNAEVTMMEHLMTVRQQIYGDLLQRYEDARINEQVRANAITIVEQAGLPQRPSSPNVPFNAALGLVAGLALGVILAFLFEGMDDTVRAIEEVQAMSTAPILCQVPEENQGSALAVSAAFYQLRARLFLSRAMPKSTSLLITSPEPGAGKSTVAAKLALSIAEAGRQVVLVDMDFYHPRLQSIFNLPKAIGLRDYMCGDVPLEAVLQDTSYPTLRVATAGSSETFPSDWLTPVKIGGLLDDLAKDSDYLLVDAPALLSVADPTVLASQADAVLLVVALRVTERKPLRFALQQLGELNTHIAGIVVNKVPASRLNHYYQKRKQKKAKSRPAEEAQTEAVVDVRSKG